MTNIEGEIKGRGRKIGIVVSRFNDIITRRLLEGCLKTLKVKGVNEASVTVVWVPGSFEIPLVAKKLAAKRSVQCVICLGAVIRGETFHFDLVAREAASGISQVALESGKPVIFGVITTDTIGQADERSGNDGNNKGSEAAEVALEMVDVFNQLKKMT